MRLTFSKFKNPARAPRIRIRCDCGCRRHLDIFADSQGAEIGGVHGGKRAWEKLFSQIFNPAQK
jgi:hypothetical protein